MVSAQQVGSNHRMRAKEQDPPADDCLLSDELRGLLGPPHCAGPQAGRNHLPILASDNLVDRVSMRRDKDRDTLTTEVQSSLHRCLSTNKGETHLFLDKLG